MPDVVSLADIPEHIPAGPVYRFIEGPGEPRSILPSSSPDYKSVILIGEEDPEGFNTVPPCTVVWMGQTGRGVCLREHGHGGHHASQTDDENGDERVVAVWGNHPESDVPYLYAVQHLGMEDWLGMAASPRKRVN